MSGKPQVVVALRWEQAEFVRSVLVPLAKLQQLEGLELDGVQAAVILDQIEHSMTDALETEGGDDRP